MANGSPVDCTAHTQEMINILTSMMTGQVSLEALQRLYNFLRDYFN